MLVLMLPSAALISRGALLPTRPALRSAPRMDVAELAQEMPAAAPEAPAPVAALEVPIAALEVPVATPEVPAIAADVVPQDLSLPDLPLPDLPLPDLSELLDVASQFVRIEYLPLIAAFTVLPMGAFLSYILLDGFAGLFRLVTGKKTTPRSPVSGPLAAEAEGEPSVWAAEAAEGSFDTELSAWPVILQMKRELEAMPAEEARRTKLEVGTNWKPRTTTAKPFADDREGFMFFQGPTPLTAVQPDLPGFFSGDNFKGVSPPPVLLVSVGTFSAALLAVLGVVFLT